MTAYLPDLSPVVAAFVLANRIFLPGMAWVWFFDRAGDGLENSGWRRWLVSGAVSAIIGLLYAVLSTLLLSELGVYRPVLDMALVALVTIAGVCLGARHDCFRLLVGVKRSSAALLGAILLFGCVLAFAPRSEWIAGGWDPGIYLNQGIATARTGTIHPPAVDVNRQLTVEELAIFSRRAGSHYNVFRGVPITTDTRAMVYYFYRLTPSAMAFVARHGGIEAAVHTNALLGVLAALAFAAALARNRVSTPHLYSSVLLLVASPVWLSHLHFPTSEMLHLLLMGAIVLLLPERNRTGPLILTGTVLLAAVLNRISVLPFAGVFLLCLAAADILREDRRRVWLEMMVLLAGIVLGAVYDFTAARVTTAHLHRSVPLLLAVCAIAVTVAAVLTGLGSAARVRRRVSCLPGWVLPAGVGVLMIVYTAVACWGRGHGIGSLDNAVHLAPYLGVTLGVIALCEFPLFFCSRCSRELRVAVAFMMAATAILLINKSIVGIYPWATRRFLPYAVPAVAILAGHAVSRLHRLRAPLKPWGRVAGVVVLLVLLRSNARRSYHAWARTDFSGLIEVLQQVAVQVADDEVVVADHDDWGTPLMLVFGKQVLNGRYFYASEGTECMERGLAALRRLAAGVNRIRFLTCTPEGLECYPLPVPGAKLEWSSNPFPFELVVHHRSATGYEVVRKSRVFRLYAWDPTGN